MTRLDGFQNVITGLGIKGRDKVRSTQAVREILSREEADILYRADDIARKVITLLPREAFREGYDIQIDKQQLEPQKVWLKAKLKRLRFDYLARRAWEMARQYGGAAIVLGIQDGRRMDEPVDEFNIQDIAWAQVFDRWQLPYEAINRDITSRSYGQPTRHLFSPIHTTPLPQNETAIHRSRMIVFDGHELPDLEYQRNAYWHASVLEVLLRPIQNFNAAHDSGASLVADFAQAVFKMKDLTDLLSADKDDLVIKRLEYIDRSRSVINAAVLEDGEEFTRVTTPISGLPELIQLVSMRLVAAAEMPHNLVLGEGAKGGLGSEGQTENRDWYDFVAQTQENVLRPRLEATIRLLQLCKASPLNGALSSGVSVVFKPLWQMDEKESVSLRNTQAQTDNIYIAAGVLDPEEVAQSRFGSAEYSIETNLLADRQSLASFNADNFDLYESIDFTLPVEVLDNLRLGLTLWQQLQDQKALAQHANLARDLINGMTIAPTNVLKWHQWFLSTPAPENPSPDTPPTAERALWQLRGGQFGKDWVNKLADRMQQAEQRNGRV